jgi:hypothetical protein
MSSSNSQRKTVITTGHHSFLLLYSVLILKVASELVTGGLQSAIGEPQDYNKNLDNNRFPDNIDITVPERMSSGSHIEDKLDHINLSERKETL